MGNHFRTPSEEPVTPQVPQVGTPAPSHAEPSSSAQDRLFEQPVQHSVFDASAPAADIASAEGFAPLRQGEAAAAPQAAANPLFSVPSPEDAPASRAWRARESSTGANTVVKSGLLASAASRDATSSA